MKNILLFILLITTQVIESQNLYTRDNINIGKRKKFMKNCEDVIRYRRIDTSKYKKFDYIKYCDCICDEVIPNLNYIDLEKAVESNKIGELFGLDSNQLKIQKCLSFKIVEIDTNIYEGAEKFLVYKNHMINECKKNILKDSLEDKFVKSHVDELCQCIYTNKMNRGVKRSEIKSITKGNNILENEIYLPCYNKILRYKSDNINIYNPIDLISNSDTTRVPLLKYLGNLFKIKLSIAGISRYFIFDTGASDISIDQDLEKELIDNDLILDSSYIGKRKYQLADNRIVEKELIICQNIEIGDFKVNNVIVSVGSDSSLLLGMSFLNKFKNWFIDNENSQLILIK